MLTHLADVSLRSLLLMALAGIALVVTRKYRSPALQHAIWTAGLLGTLALFAIGEILPRLPLQVLNAALSQNIAIEATAANESFVPSETLSPASPSTKAPRSNTNWTALATGLYALIAAAFSIRFLFGMLLVRRLLAQSTSVDNFRESDRIGIPVTAGWLHPVIVLPKEWREWDQQKLEAVLAHERAHVRRKDNLIAGLAGLNRCLLWFNPLAWWLERRLALLAEQACDEASILALGGSEDDREDYVRLLLNMAATVNGSHGRLRTHVLAMASRSQIRQRVEPLLQTRRALSRGLTKAALAALAICCIPVVWATGSIDVTRQAAQLRLDVSRFTIATPHVPPQPLQLLAQTQTPVVPPRPPQPARFEVASIRENPGPWHVIHGYSASGPRLTLEGWSIAALVQEAYGLKSYQTIYTPATVTLYNIAAKAEGDEALTHEQFRPLLQRLLTERFAVTFHREMRDIPVYTMVIGKNGVKFKESDAGEPNRSYGGVYGRNQSVELQQGTMEQLAESIPGSVLADRPVIDKTGLTGKYDIRLEATPYIRINNSPQPDDLSVFDAIQQQLGLKLEAQKASVEVIVVDSVEKPTEN